MMSDGQREASPCSDARFHPLVKLSQAWKPEIWRVPREDGDGAAQTDPHRNSLLMRTLDHAKSTRKREKNKFVLLCGLNKALNIFK